MTKIGGEEIKKILFSCYGSLVTNNVTLAVLQTIKIDCFPLCIEKTLFRHRLTRICPLGIIYICIYIFLISEDMIHRVKK